MPLSKPFLTPALLERAKAHLLTSDDAAITFHLEGGTTLDLATIIPSSAGSIEGECATEGILVSFSPDVVYAVEFGHLARDFPAQEDALTVLHGKREDAIVAMRAALAEGDTEAAIRHAQAIDTLMVEAEPHFARNRDHVERDPDFREVETRTLDDDLTAVGNTDGREPEAFTATSPVRRPAGRKAERATL